jgi:hypothetical protein
MQNSSVLVASSAVWKPPQKTMPAKNPLASSASSEYLALGRLRTFQARRRTPALLSFLDPSDVPGCAAPPAPAGRTAPAGTTGRRPPGRSRAGYWKLYAYEMPITCTT